VDVPRLTTLLGCTAGVVLVAAALLMSHPLPLLALVGLGVVTGVMIAVDRGDPAAFVPFAGMAALTILMLVGAGHLGLPGLALAGVALVTLPLEIRSSR
jgi:hypothetical protein